MEEECGWAPQQTPDPSLANRIFHPFVKPFWLETGLAPVFAGSLRGTLLLRLWGLIIGMEVCAARRPEVESASAKTGGRARGVKASF